MILKKLLNSQLLKLSKEFKRKYSFIWDIAIYGSVVRGKVNPNDIDFALLFSKIQKLDKKLKIAQEFKNKLKKIFKEYDIDVKALDFRDFFDSSFLARKAIISEAYLILHKKFLHELLGFNTYYLFLYSLKGLKQSKKIMIHYSLKGRRGEKGLLEIMKGKLLGKGVIKIPLQHVEEFKEFMEKNKIKFRMLPGLFY